MYVFDGASCIIHVCLSEGIIQVVLAGFILHIFTNQKVLNPTCLLI